MKRHVLIPLAILLLCGIGGYTVTQWDRPAGSDTNTMVSVDEGKVEVKSLKNPGDKVLLSHNEKVNSSNGKLSAVERTPGPTPKQVAVATDADNTEAQPGHQSAEDQPLSATREGYWISGHVKTNDGRFIGGAKITALKQEDAYSRYGHKYTKTIMTLDAYTDNVGQYEIETGGAGRYELRSSLPGSAGEFLDAFAQVNLSREEKTKTQDFVHRAGSGYWILGTVKSEDGQPIPNSTIEARDDNFETGRRFEAHTDSQGRFAVQVDQPAGYLTISTPPADYVQQIAKIWLSREQKQMAHHFVHPRGACVAAGKVLTKQTSKPITGARVVLVRHPGDQTRKRGDPSQFEAVTDRNGEFRVSVVKGEYSLSADAKGFISYQGGRSDGLSRWRIDENSSPVTIRMQTGLAALIRVKDSDGNPVPNAEISFRTSAGKVNQGRTDSDGEYLADTMPNGLAIAKVEKRDGNVRNDRVPRSSVNSEPFRPGPPDNPTVVDVELTTACSISGQVTYEDTGEVATEREVNIGFDSIDAVMPGSSMMGAWSTDANGKYTITGLAPGKYTVMIESKGSYRMIAEKKVELAPAQQLTGCDFEIDREEEATEEVKGRVVNLEGEPVTGASVHISVRPPDSPQSPTSDLEFTDKNGGFHFTNLKKAETFSLRIHEDGYKTHDKEYPMNGESLSIALEPAGSVSGVVVEQDTQAPVEGARVEVAGSRDAVGITNAIGEFQITNVQPGTHAITAEAPGYRKTDGSEITLKAGQALTGVVIEIEPGGIVQGVVVGPDGVPVPETVLALKSKIENPHMGFFSSSFKPPTISDTVKTALDGTFRMSGASPTGDGLMVQHRDFAPQTVPLPKEKIGQGSVRIQLTRGGALEGLVVDRNQNPVPHAGIGVFNYPQNYFCYRTNTDENGEFRLEHLPALSFTVTVDKTDGPTESQRVTVVEGKTVRADFGTGEGAVIRGTVYKGGEPVPGARINLQQRGRNDMRNTVSNVDGSYAFQGVSEGEGLIIYTTNPDHRYLSSSNCEGIRRIYIRDSQKEYNVDLQVILYEIVGTVRNAESGQPIPQAKVRLARSGGTRWVHVGGATSDESGRFVIKPAEPRTYTFAVMAEGYQTKEFTVNVPADANQVEVRIPVEVQLQPSTTAIRAHLSHGGGPVVTDRMHFMAFTSDGHRYEVPFQPDEGQPGTYVITCLSEGAFDLRVTCFTESGILMAYPQPISVQKGQTASVFMDLFKVVRYSITLEPNDRGIIQAKPQVIVPDSPAFTHSFQDHVYINGNQLNLELPEGRHRVQLGVPGYRLVEFVPADIADFNSDGDRGFLTIALQRE